MPINCLNISRELMNEIALGMKNLVEMTDLYDDYANLEMEQKIEIEVCEWKKDLLAVSHYKWQS